MSNALGSVADRLLAHYEAILGTCSGHWINDPRDAENSLADVAGLSHDDLYQVLRFQDSPEQGASTYVTYGLGRKVLTLEDPRSNQTRDIRLELLACARDDIDSAYIAYLLMSFGNAMLRKRQAPVKGEIIKMGSVLENPKFQYLYCTEPLLHPAELADFNGTSPETVLAWLFPITAAEADFVLTKGYRTFHECLRTEDADVLAFDQRSEVRLPLPS